jgi:hypothetical protein
MKWQVLISFVSLAFQKIKKQVSNSLKRNVGLMQDQSQEHSDAEHSVENFIAADWKDDTIAVMLCIKCEESFEIDPCKEENIVWCSQKKVFVPQCPHCGTNDVE